MSFDQISLFAIFAAVMVLMFAGRWRHDLVAFGGLMAAVLLGVVPAEEAFAGFGHPATMVVALILVVTAGLRRSGAEAMLARIVEARDGGPYASLSDFFHRARVSRPVLERLVLAGGFDSVGHPRRAQSAPTRAFTREGGLNHTAAMSNSSPACRLDIPE